MGGFALQEGEFAWEAPPVAGGVAGFPEDPMAGDGDGEGVGGARAGDGANGGGSSEGGGNSGIGRRGARGNGLQGVPDGELEWGAVEVDGESEGKAGGIDGAHYFAEGLAERRAGGSDGCLGEAVPQVSEELFRGVAEEDGADTGVGGGGQDGTQGASARGEPDVGGPSAFPESRGSQPGPSLGCGIRAGGRGNAGFHRLR